MRSSLTPNQDNDIEARMAARYGTRRSRWPSITIAVIAVGAFLMTTSWAVLQLADEPFQATVLRWHNEGHRVVSVDLEVRGASRQNVRCAVRAKDSSASDVGYAFVAFSHAPDTHTFRIPTVIQTSSVEVLACGSAGEELVVAPSAYPPGVAPPPTSPLP